MWSYCNTCLVWPPQVRQFTPDSDTAVLSHSMASASSVSQRYCRLLTGSILAHELMHGWLRLKGTWMNKFTQLNIHSSIFSSLWNWLKKYFQKLYWIVLFRLPKPKRGGWRRYMPGHVLPVAGIRDSSVILKARAAFIILCLVLLFVLSTNIVQERENISYWEEAGRVLHAPDCQWHINGLWWRFQNCVCCRQQVWPSPNTEPYTPNRRLPCIIREGKKRQCPCRTQHKDHMDIKGYIHIEMNFSMYWTMSKKIIIPYSWCGFSCYSIICIILVFVIFHALFSWKYCSL